MTNAQTASNQQNQTINKTQGTGTTAVKSNMMDTRKFSNEDFELLTIKCGDGEIWFFAKDICSALNLQTPYSIQSLSFDDVDYVPRRRIGLPSGGRRAAIVNEAGLNSLVARSHKPEAKVFQHWVTHEVLPSVRQTGAYVSPEFAIAEKIASGDIGLAIQQFESVVRLTRQLWFENVALTSKVEQHYAR